MQYKFATAVQHFLLLLQKKTLAKEKEPGGISISLRTSLNRPEKPLRFFWTFPAIAEKPMRIRTALNFYPQGILPHIFKRNCLQICCTVSGGAYQDARKVTIEWDAELKHWGLPEFRCRTHPTVTQRPFLPYLFPRKGKDRAVGDNRQSQICDNNPSVSFADSSLYTREPWSCNAGGAAKAGYALSVSAAPSQLPWKGSQGARAPLSSPIGEAIVMFKF